MIKGIINYFFILFILICFTQCATVSTPTGGPKDTLPPQLLSSTTENFATNFSESNIILTFNEFVKLNNPSQNIVTSPPMGDKLGLHATKNKVFITFKEDLEPNLTYHINFGNSIQDVNESNPLNNFQFIFSTGDKIDSMSISGQLTPVNDEEISATTLVGLYRNVEDDSVFYKEAPFYFAYANQNGQFDFKHIKNGDYIIRALSDANGNRFYDLPNELIGYYDGIINLDSALFNFDISLFQAEPETQRVVNFTNNINAYFVEFELAIPLSVSDKYSLTFLADSIQEIEASQIVLTEDKIISIQFDSIIQNLNQLSTIILINDEVVDTLNHSISNLKKPEQKIELKSNKWLKNDSIIVTCSVPIASIVKNIAIIDTSNGDTTLVNAVKSPDGGLFIELVEKYEENGVYTLLIRDSSLIDHLGRYNEKISLDFKIESEEARGSLFLTFEKMDSSKNYIVELLNKAEERISRKVINTKNYKWDFYKMKAEEYHLKIIEDDNRDGRWNSGSIKNKTFPEKIYEYPKEIIIRENWELEETIELSQNEE